MWRRAAAGGLAVAGAAAAAVTAAGGLSLFLDPRAPRVDRAALWAGSPDRFALVLGIGGVAGAAWEAAVLARLCGTGLDPRRAGLVIGTSAGALVAAVLRAGLHASQLEQFAASGGVDLPDGRWQLPDPRVGQLRDADVRHPLGQAWHAVRAGRLPHLTSAAAAGLLPPRGFALDDVAVAVDDLAVRVGGWSGWPVAPTWVPAVDAYTGQRVVFGVPGEPVASLGTAVMASCAVPGVFSPVRVGDRWYVDGGVVSFTSLDLALAAGARRVLVVNPMAGPLARGRSGAAAVAESMLRRAMRVAYGRSVGRARSLGVQVRAVVPTVAEAEAVGPRLLDFDRGELIVRAVSERRLDESWARWG